jgi:hypothetical protein
MGLIIKNIGGARQAIEDMGVLGNPMKYSLVLGEFEEESPWTPLHIDRGFKPDDSTVTVFFPNSYNQTLAYGTDAKSLLSTFIYNVQPGRFVQGMACFVITPTHAKMLLKEGWQKKDVISFISENTTAPFYRHSSYWGASAGLSTPIPTPLNPDDPIRLLPYPERILIVVAGGPGNFTGLIRGSGFSTHSYVTKKVELPAKWKSLVDKYQNLVPNYIKY